MEDLTFLAIMVAVAFLCWNLIPKLANNRKLNLPPGPPGIPILGNLAQLGPLPYRTTAAWNLKYGPLVAFKMGSKTAITSSSPRVIRELLMEETFSSRPTSSQAKILAYSSKGLGLAPYGLQWKKMRRISVEHLLTPRRVESFQSQRAEESRALVQAILREAGTGKVISVREHFGSYTMNVVTRMLIGKRYFGASTMGVKEATDFKELMHESVALHGLFFLPDYVPLLWWYDPKGYRREMFRQAKLFDDYYTEIFEEHRARRRAPGEARDFVDVLLELSAEDSDLSDDKKMKALLQDMVVGGTDTASYAMEWFMLEMLRNPKVLKKNQQEIETVLGRKPANKHLVEESDLGSMDYLRASVKELFRIHPVGGYLIPHESIRDAKVAGYDVPKGTLVLINNHGLGRNPEVWERPEEFIPERFAVNSDERVFLKDPEYRVLPFSAGKRQCPGAQLGQTMLLLALAKLLHGFDWEPAPGVAREEIDVEETPGLTNPPRTPLRVVATPRLDRSFD